jgi:hypothetical protein
MSGKQCCGSGMFIPDPDFIHPGSRSRIPDPAETKPRPRMKLLAPGRKLPRIQHHPEADPHHFHADPIWLFALMRIWLNWYRVPSGTRT